MARRKVFYLRVRMYGFYMAILQHSQRWTALSAFVMGDDSTTEINTTCLEEPKTATSDWGLTTPGEGSIQIDTDPKNLSHMKLLELAADRVEVGVYVGWSDGEGVPTVGGLMMRC